MRSLPEIFNAATHFVDRQRRRRPRRAGRDRMRRRACDLSAGRRARQPIRLRAAAPRHPARTAHRADPAGHARVRLRFFGAIKAGVVPVPLNTLVAREGLPARAQRQRRACARDQRGAAARSSRRSIARELPRLEHVIVVGEPRAGVPQLRRAARAIVARRSMPSRRTRTRWRSGCIRRAAPAAPRAACTCSTTCSCAPSRTRRACSACASPIAASASPSCSSPTASATRLYMPFAVGATSILLPDAPAAPRVYEIIERYKPTLFFSVPTNFGMLLAHERSGRDFDLSSVRYAVSAGEALPESLFRRFKQRFGVEILDAIGSTECLHMFIANRPGPRAPGIERPARARLRRAHRRRRRISPLPVGEMGNLLIKGDSTCAYYWNQHEKTKQTIQGEWIRTGDKYYCDADGYLLVRRPHRRHVEGRRHLGQPDRDRERADRSRRRAGVRGDRPRRWRWIVEAVRVCGAASRR